jgi:hypothetical protein
MNAVVWKWLTLCLVAAVAVGAFWLAGALHEPPRGAGFQLALATPDAALVPLSLAAPQSIAAASSNDSQRR